MSAPAPKQQVPKPAAPPKRPTAEPAAPAAKPAPTQQPKLAPTRRSSGTGSARDGVRKAQGAQRRATQFKRKGRGKGGKKLL